MTDASPPIPGSPEANDLVVRGDDGDPIRDSRLVRMTERESYERIVEGLKMAADASQHLARQEVENHDTWMALAVRLDQVRRIAVQIAGLDLTMKQQETVAPRGSESMAWRSARERFRDGIRQAAGGMRQLATCFRIDLRWSNLARMLEAMDEKTLGKAAARTRASIILPAGYRQ